MGWMPVTPINEVQTLRIRSDCFSLSNCENTYYFLAYGDLKTGALVHTALYIFIIFAFCMLFCTSSRDGFLFACLYCLLELLSIL